VTAPNVQAILALETPIIVLIGERAMPLRDVVALVPGAIVELPKQAHEELELLVNNKPIGSGLPVKVGENFGLRISYIGDLRERIAALGPREFIAAAAPGSAPPAPAAPEPPPTADAPPAQAAA
jgi:flagellar motor switch protein FliN/FliY